MPKIRIKDIASIANVSAGTVDRVIHHRSGVSESTRIKIQRLLEKYDYQPDILAGNLASGKVYKFLICMPEVVGAHEFWRFPEIGIRKAIKELEHFDIEVNYIRFDQHSQSDFEQKIRNVEPEKFDGLLFAPVFSNHSSEFVESWNSASRPVIQFNSRIENFETNGFIGQDAMQSGFLGGKLMSYGLTPGRDILIVNLSLREDNYQHILKRESGFKSFFEEHSDRVSNLVSLNLNGGEYERVSSEISRKMEEFDVAGIFVTNSRVHLIGRFLAERGIMNVRLIGYDLLPESIEYLRRDYIDFLISQSPEEQAYLGLKQLFNIAVLKKSISQEILLPIEILTKENIDHYLNFNAQNE